MIWSLFGIGFIVYLVKRILLIRQSRKKYRGFPQIYPLVNPAEPIALIQKRLWKDPTYELYWLKKNSKYTESETIAVIPILIGRAELLTSAPEIYKRILGDLNEWNKTSGRKRFSEFLGKNVVSSQGEDWKRHRRITAPAFNATTYKNVWDTSVRVYKEMVEQEAWDCPPPSMATKTGVADLTRKFAMYIVTSCSFGVKLDWKEEDNDLSPTGAEPWTIQRIVQGASETILIYALTPKALLKLLPFAVFRKTKASYEKMETLAQELVKSRELAISQNEKLENGAMNDEVEKDSNIQDILGRLVHARSMVDDDEERQGEKNRRTLSNREIIGNCFIFLFAGHETTAHTLAATLTLLGLYPDIQEDMYRRIVEVCGDSEPSFEHYEALFPILACFYEALRLCPPGWKMVREAQYDHALSGVFPSTSSKEGKQEITVTKGDVIGLDVIGVCYNPRAFPEPCRFNPYRWASPSGNNPYTDSATAEDPAAGTANPNDHPAFAYGPRVCLGKKFSTTEAVAFLACLLREWKVETPRLRGDGVGSWEESAEDAVKRLIDPGFGFTLLLKERELVLTRRR